MNYLVFLDTRAGELEKILSGIKTMIVKEFNQASTGKLKINPGDSLYFLRNNDEYVLQVKATVIRILSFTDKTTGDLSHLTRNSNPGYS